MKRSMALTLGLLTLFGLLATEATQAESGKKISVLLVDGQNNHRWQETTPMLKKILENAGIFEVTVSTAPPGTPRKPRGPKGKNVTAKQKEEYAKKNQ